VIKGFSALLIVSGLIVTLAPNYPTLMVGRVLLGLAIGGFWSMSTAVVMRLLPDSAVPKALSLIQGGTALASTISAPLGSLLGAYIGWRGAFFLIVPVAVIALIWQSLSLPALPARKSGASGNVFRLLARPPVALGMASTMLLFMGQFALFTYLRPYLEIVSGFDIKLLSFVLLLMGFGGVAGTYAAGQLANARMFAAVVAIPAVMAVLALALINAAGLPIAVAALLIAWGFFATGAPVGWGTWLSRTLPDDAEAGGGLQVAVIQLGITVGAAFGGVLFDTIGWWGPFAFAAVLLGGSSLLAFAAWRATWTTK
jgi:predicted MFS family arabinose efflux permease